MLGVLQRTPKSLRVDHRQPFDGVLERFNDSELSERYLDNWGFNDLSKAIFRKYRHICIYYIYKRKMYSLSSLSCSCCRFTMHWKLLLVCLGLISYLKVLYRCVSQRFPSPCTLGFCRLMFLYGEFPHSPWGTMGGNTMRLHGVQLFNEDMIVNSIQIIVKIYRPMWRYCRLIVNECVGNPAVYYWIHVKSVSLIISCRLFKNSLL